MTHGARTLSKNAKPKTGDINRYDRETHTAVLLINNAEDKKETLLSSILKMSDITHIPTE